MANVPPSVKEQLMELPKNLTRATAVLSILMKQAERSSLKVLQVDRDKLLRVEGVSPLHQGRFSYLHNPIELGHPPSVHRPAPLEARHRLMRNPLQYDPNKARTEDITSGAMWSMSNPQPRKVAPRAVEPRVHLHN
eukprot:RCo022666